MQGKPGRPKKYFYFGLDAGNGSIKFVGEDFKERIPSYKCEYFLPGTHGSVKVDNRFFTIGEGAKSTSRTFRRTVDDRFAKVQDLQSLYLGALSHFNCTPEMHVRVVVSSHAWAAKKEEIKANLEGTDLKATLSGVDVNLTTEVLMVVPEGFGGAYKESGEVATLDFGNGTTTLTLYNKRKPVGEPLLEHYGVQKLFQLIATEMVPWNGDVKGNVDLIREAIENKFSQVDGVSIKEIYKQCLNMWWNEGLSNLSKEVKRLVDKKIKVICIGGGVLLPTFEKVLIKRGLSIAKDPVMANALGLYELAVQQGTKKGEYNV